MKKPHLKLAYTLVVLGAGLFMLERWGLQMLSGGPATPHLGGLLTSVLVLVPVGLIAAGCVVFAYGSIRRVK